MKTNTELSVKKRNNQEASLRERSKESGAQKSLSTSMKPETSSRT